MLRAETKARARALQLLYAWELQGRDSLPAVASRSLSLCRLRTPDTLHDAEDLAGAVVSQVEVLDGHAAAAADNWRLSRLGVVERNILRLGIHELAETSVPPKVAIDEAVQLAHWFGGAKSPAFVNGVLDRVAHSLGQL